MIVEEVSKFRGNGISDNENVIGCYSMFPSVIPTGVGRKGFFRRKQFQKLARIAGKAAIPRPRFESMTHKCCFGSFFSLIVATSPW